MGTADRIERERFEKRARILDAARQLFVERGVEAVTLREVAQRIEYSTTAIYVHFKDKAALLDALVTEDFAAFASGLEAAARVVDPVERLGVLHDAYVDFAFRMPRHYQLLFMTPAKAEATTAAQDPAGVDGYRVLLATVSECIRAGRFRAALTDPHEVAQVVWANVHGLVSLLIVMGSHPHFDWRSRPALSRMSLRVTLGGLLRDHDALDDTSARKKKAPATAKARSRRS
jgi:AcrR family transcriptional regulator